MPPSGEGVRRPHAEPDQGKTCRNEDQVAADQPDRRPLTESAGNHAGIQSRDAGAQGRDTK
jgi:hypothetical protein